MTLVPIDLPAGVYKNGTDLEGQGRWQDASLVRWRDNTLRPVGGWTSRKTGFSTNPIRGFHTWEANDGSRFYAGGSYNELKVATANNTVYDITPLDLTDGDEHSALETGYGYGAYGDDTYGTERSSFGSYSEANTWSLDNWGEYLVACSYADGRILEWQIETGLGDELVSNGDFSTIPDTSWTAATGWTISSSGTYPNTATHNYPSATTLTQDISVNAAQHRITFDVGGLGASNTIRVRVGVDISGPDEVIYLSEEVANGSHSFDFDITAAGTVTIMVNKLQTVTPEWYIDNISLKQFGIASALANAPIGNLGLVVTEERILFALGAGNNPRKVQWCDIEDNTAWTPTSANQAGDIELQTAGQIMQGIRTRGQVLILTDIDAHSARYSGPPFIYGFQRVGTACGAISRAAAVDTDAGVFWMGQRGFFRFDGNVVQEVPCDVFDHVFGEIQDRNKSKVWAWNNSEFGEVWWFYQSDAQTDTGEIDKYVAYDFKENHWHIGSLSRTAGAPRGVFRHPLLLESTDVYEHEQSNIGATNMFAETGPIQLGNGDNITHVTQMIADERAKGDVQVKFKSRFYPNGDETEHGPFNPATPTGLRFAGRQFKMRVEPDDGSNFRLGIVRVDAQQGGKR
jgi:hypothetical protein